jgi:hypothetical protein
MSGQFDPHDLQNDEDRAATSAWRRLIEEDEGWREEIRQNPMRLGEKQLEAIFETVRGTLEDSGIPFLRANTLAERVRSAVREL